jgi:hypothetical protein
LIKRHTMKTYEEWRYSSTILDFRTKWGFLGKQPTAPIGHKAGWTPEPVWTLCRREKYLAPAENQTLAIQPVACHSTNWYNGIITSGNDNQSKKVIFAILCPLHRTQQQLNLYLTFFFTRGSASWLKHSSSSSSLFP